MTILQHKLQTLRAWRNLSKNDIARTASIPIFDICQLERGTLELSYHTESLARAYGLTVKCFEEMLDTEYERRVSGEGNTSLPDLALNLLASAESGCFETLVVLDLETTSARKEDAEVVQITLLDHTGAVLLNSLVKPDHKIPSGASLIHHIYDADVADAPPFAELWGKVYDLLNGANVIIYNAGYDSYILQQWAHKHTLKFPECDFYCLMLEYCEWLRTSQKLERRPKWQKLTEACSQQGVVLEDAHSASGDTLATLELLKAMARKQEEVKI